MYHRLEKEKVNDIIKKGYVCNKCECDLDDCENVYEKKGKYFCDYCVMECRGCGRIMMHSNMYIVKSEYHPSYWIGLCKKCYTDPLVVWDKFTK